MIERARGTRDFGPAEMAQRQIMESVLDSCATRHGFHRVQTPTFERLDLFTAKSGAGIVDQLYAFQDRSDRHLTLRPELTAPVMRMIADGLHASTKPLRLAYHGPCFRYEESKKGRYREFFQYGVEVVGAHGPLVDAEVLALAVAMLDELGLSDWILRVGHVGILRDILGGFGLRSDTEPAGSSLAEVMRLLDKGDLQGALERIRGASPDIDPEMMHRFSDMVQATSPEPALEAAHALLDGLGITSDALTALESTLSSLSALAPAPPRLDLDLTVARGLDYYTGMVFEVHVPALGGESQVLGGGTYRLLHLFGHEDLDPSCGFGLGFDRVLLALEDQGVDLKRIRPGPPRIAAIAMGGTTEHLLPLVRALRHEGLVADLSVRERNFGRSMRWADATGADVALLLGPKDLEAGQVTLKHLESGTQVTAPMELEAVRDAVLDLLV